MHPAVAVFHLIGRMVPLPSRRSTPSSASSQRRSSSASLSAAVSAIRRPHGGPSQLAVSTSSRGVSRLTPPLSSRSAGVSGGSAGYLLSTQKLSLLGKEEISKYCFGWIGSSSGPKTRVCTASKVEGQNSCGVSSHDRRCLPESDAYYIPTRGSSVLIWPFVYQHHVESTGSRSLVTSFLTTEAHVEALHRFYDEHPECWEEVISRPRVCQLVGVSVDRNGDRLSASGSIVSGSRSVLGEEEALHELPHDSTVPISSVEHQNIDYDLQSVDSWEGQVESELLPFAGIISSEGLQLQSPFPDEDSEEPWAKANIIVHAFVNQLSSRIATLASTTESLFRKELKGSVRQSKELQALQNSLQSLLRDVNGPWTRSDTYDQYPSIWDGVLFAISAKDDVESCLTASAEALEIANDAHVFAETVDADLTEEMEQVAQGFEGITTRLTAVERGGAVSRVASRLAASRAALSLDNSSATVPTENIVGGGSVSASISTADLHRLILDLQQRVDSQQMKLDEREALIQSQKDDLTSMKLDLQTLQGDSSKAHFNHFSLHDEAGLATFLEEQDFDPSRVAAFCDMNSLMSHATDQFKGISEYGERTKLMQQCGIADQSSQKTIFSFEKQYPPGFATGDDGDVKDGETFPVLKTKKVWVGSDGRSGARAKYLDKVNTAAERATAYVSRYTKSGPLQEVCMEMIRTSQRFWTAFYDYLNNDLERLIQFGIAEKECLVLISEQMKIVFEQVFAKRMMMPEFSVPPDEKVPIEYAAQIFYFTLQAHSAMDDFMAKKFTGHGLLGNTFIRFLARQCGNTSVAGFEKRVERLEKDLADHVKKLNKRMDELLVSVNKKTNAKGPGGANPPTTG